MLTHTFSHLNGIGRRVEARLWARGVLRWEDFQGVADTFSSRRAASVRTQLVATREAWERRDWAFFLRRLPAADRVRLLPHVREGVGFVDIETTGLSRAAEVTTIALYDGRMVRWYVRGRDLDQFVADVAPFQLLVTYNGARFDLPFLRETFGPVFPQLHVDLCPVLRAQGVWGGLKACERQIGIERQTPEGLSGADAVALWNRYARCKDEGALRLLLAYNAQDAVNLEGLMVHAYNRSMSGFPGFSALPLPVQPRLWSDGDSAAANLDL